MLMVPHAPHGGERAAVATTARVGMVGAGQLARMTYQTGISLGLTVRLLAERLDDSAAQVGADVHIGSPRSPGDLAAFATGCDVVTFDHELVDASVLADLAAAGRCVRPSPDVVALAQNKRRQRETLSTLGCPVPPFRVVQTVQEVAAFGTAHGWPLILKAARGGYDGRGVWLVEDEMAAGAVLRRAADSHLELLAEQRVPIEREIAVLVARRPSGERVVYPVVETVQENGICRELLVPAPIEPGLAAEAGEVALGIADAIDATGMLAVEMFVAGDRVIVNELAARPHNSGHFSLGGCVTSQFENHLRAVLDWPLGDPSPLAPVVATVNVLGDASGADPRAHLDLALAVPGVRVHLYGKAARPGRKLGHVTAVGTDVNDTRQRARKAAALLAAGPAAEGMP